MKVKKKESTESPDLLLSLSLEAETIEEQAMLGRYARRVEEKTKLAPEHAATLEFVRTHPRCTSNAIAREFDIAPPAANNRLTRLLRLHLIERERCQASGLTYVYWALESNDGI